MRFARPRARGGAFRGSGARGTPLVGRWRGCGPCARDTTPGPGGREGACPAPFLKCGRGSPPPQKDCPTGGRFILRRPSDTKGPRVVEARARGVCVPSIGTTPPHATTTFTRPGGGGGLARGQWCGGVCLWRRRSAPRHGTSGPSVGPNVFWLCQRSPRMTCPVFVWGGGGRGGCAPRSPSPPHLEAEPPIPDLCSHGPRDTPWPCRCGGLRGRPGAVRSRLGRGPGPFRRRRRGPSRSSAGARSRALRRDRVPSSPAPGHTTEGLWPKGPIGGGLLLRCPPQRPLMPHDPQITRGRGWGTTVCTWALAPGAAHNPNDGAAAAPARAWVGFGEAAGLSVEFLAGRCDLRDHQRSRGNGDGKPFASHGHATWTVKASLPRRTCGWCCVLLW